MVEKVKCDAVNCEKKWLGTWFSHDHKNYCRDCMLTKMVRNGTIKVQTVRKDYR